MSADPDPARIMATATGFWASKTLLSAVELDLFTTLSGAALTADELGARLDVHPRARRDFFDALVALRFLERDGDGPEARYRNAPETAAFLDRNSTRWIGGMPLMLGRRLYGFWAGLTTALKTGEAQSESRHGGASFFETVYADPDRLEQFLLAMNGFQAANFALLAERFPFEEFGSVADVGGALALLSRVLAERHGHLALISFDLPAVTRLAERHVRRAGLSDRITLAAGSFLEDPLPEADVIVMGNVLHDWNLETKRLLIRKAHDALPRGGALVAIENLIDDARRENVFALLMSLNMLVEFGDAFDYTMADFRGWGEEAGFRRFETIPLAGPASAAVAWK